MSDLRGGSMAVFMVFDSPKGRIYQFMMEHPHDTLVPGISVQRLLTILLGEESAESIWGLVEQWGDKGERAVMPLIEEIVKGRQEIQACAEKLQTCEEVIAHLRRQLFGQNRERYVDPGELFSDPGTVMELPQVEESDIPERKRRGKKPRFLFTEENVKDLPTEVIEIDPAGDLSHLEKIGTQEHLVLDYRRARFRVLKYVRNPYVDPTDPAAGVLTGDLPDGVQGKRTATPELLSHVVVNK